MQSNVQGFRTRVILAQLCELLLMHTTCVIIRISFARRRFCTPSRFQIISLDSMSTVRSQHFERTHFACRYS